MFSPRLTDVIKLVTTHMTTEIITAPPMAHQQQSPQHNQLEQGTQVQEVE